MVPQFYPQTQKLEPSQINRECALGVNGAGLACDRDMGSYRAERKMSERSEQSSVYLGCQRSFFSRVEKETRGEAE